MKFKNSRIAIIFAAVTACGCSAENTGFISRTYHNTTARYNAYFLAELEMQKIEALIYERTEDDFNKILPVYHAFDSTRLSYLSPLIEGVMKKASMPIVRHKNSKWTDDSFVLVGKARFYAGKFLKAKETFEYTASTAKDDAARHAALIMLMRTFIEREEYGKAETVESSLVGQKLNKKNKLALLLTHARTAQIQKNDKHLLKSLNEAVPLIKDKYLKGRALFILGQVYLKQGNSEAAYKNFKAVTKIILPYKTEFHNSLNLARVTALDEKSTEKTEKFFEIQLREQKNKEFRDKIYYEKALFKLKQDSMASALQLLNQSLREPRGSTIQKGYTYLKLGEIYYEKQKNYEKAANYYDSTVSFLDKTYPDYEKVLNKQRVLGDLADQYYTVRREDSLQRLAQSDTTEINKVLNQLVDKEEADKKAKEEQKNADQSVSDRRFTLESPFGNNIQNTWYFNNPVATANGQLEFERKWGRRPLEDHWRRSNKQAVAVYEENTAEEKPGRTKSGENTRESRIKALYAQIPFTQTQIDSSNKKIELALLKLGKIYDLKLRESEEAAQSYEQLIKRFPASESSPEAVYSLFLIHSREGNSSLADTYKNKVLTEYPNSTFAKYIRNPNRGEQVKAYEDTVNSLYKLAYELYKEGIYDESDSLINEINSAYADNHLNDKLALLQTLITAKTEDEITYRKELEEFIEQYKTSKLIPYAEELLATVKTRSEKAAEKKEEEEAENEN